MYYVGLDYHFTRSTLVVVDQNGKRTTCIIYRPVISPETTRVSNQLRSPGSFTFTDTVTGYL